MGVWLSVGPRSVFLIDDLLFSGCSAVDIYSVLKRLLQFCHVLDEGATLLALKASFTVSYVGDGFRLKTQTSAVTMGL